MISCSITHSLIGSVWLWITNASVPRTDSSKRTNSSPLANVCAVCGVIVTLRCCATSSASSRYARPEKSIRFFFGVPDLGLIFRRLPLGICVLGDLRATAITHFCLLLLCGACCLRRGCARPAPAHPVFNIALRAHRYRKRPRRHIFPDHSASTGVRTVTDRDRR